MALNAYTVRGKSNWKEICPFFFVSSLRYFSKIVQAVQLNATGFKETTKNQQNKLVLVLQNIQDLTHAKGFICLYPDTCKDIKNDNCPYECKDLQKDAKKFDSRNLSLSDLVEENDTLMESLAEVHKA